MLFNISKSILKSFSWEKCTLYWTSLHSLSDCFSFELYIQWGHWAYLFPKSQSGFDSPSFCSSQELWFIIPWYHTEILSTNREYATSNQNRSWPGCRWGLADNQFSKWRCTAETLLLGGNHLCLSASSSHFSMLSKNLSTHSWKSC